MDAFTYSQQQWCFQLQFSWWRPLLVDGLLGLATAAPMVIATSPLQSLWCCCALLLFTTLYKSDFVIDQVDDQKTYLCMCGPVLASVAAEFMAIVCFDHKGFCFLLPPLLSALAME
jgi:hypothetical protein